MGRGKQKEWARHDKKSDPFARQKNRTTNEYRQFPRLKWVVHSVHEAEQTRAAPENENITMWNFKRPGQNQANYFLPENAINFIETQCM